MRLKSSKDLDTEAERTEALDAMASARQEIGLGNFAFKVVKPEKPEDKPEKTPEKQEDKLQASPDPENNAEENELFLCTEALTKSPKTVPHNEVK